MHFAPYMKILGTMSHQIFMFEEGVVSSYVESSSSVLTKWSECFGAKLGLALADTYTHKLFFRSFSLKNALLFSGIRVDSGDEKEVTEMLIKRYKELNIKDIHNKQICYSNGLDIKKAIDIHKWVGDRLDDSYGIGTYLTADTDIHIPDKNSENGYKKPKPLNIVIKAVEGRITELREWHKLVKLSDNPEKAIGDKKKVETLIYLINSEV